MILLVGVCAVFIRPSPIISDFVDALSIHLKEIKSSAQFTGKQKFILSIVLTGIFVEGTINWAAFERKGLQVIKARTLSWFLHHAKIAWDLSAILGRTTKPREYKASS